MTRLDRALPGTINHLSREPPRVSADVPDTAASDAAFVRASEILRAGRPLRNKPLREAAAALRETRAHAAHQLLTRFLDLHPGDVDARNLMAESLMCLGRYPQAEALLAQCVSETPDFDAARFNHAKALMALNRFVPAIAQLDRLLKKTPREPLCLQLKYTALLPLGRHEDALDCSRALVEDYPGRPEAWIAHGHALRGMGERAPCIAAYREAIRLAPTAGEARRSLANLKLFRFTGDEMDDMQAQLARPDVTGANRADIHFALGKAHADLRQWENSFTNFARANAIIRLGVDHDADTVTQLVAAYRQAFTPEAFRNLASAGCNAADPIFIVGMQRAGSTLVEQILASHSAIEATTELPYISLLAKRLAEDVTAKYGSTWPDVLAKLRAPDLRGLGEQYLDDTRVLRKLGRPHVIDKMPYNFWHVGLIHLILPHAKIIEVRRHPLDCCLSNFAHHSYRTQPFIYRLSDLGRYYRDYVELMAHFDRMLPGKVHRIIYERLVADPETEIRRLLDHLELPFEEACLRFHENDRAFDSVSSEQVRTPIFHEGVGRWRDYEPWLGPLATALGPVLDAYPDVPEHKP
jgi:tetratricopeptide (TPR) repeat protein